MIIVKYYFISILWLRFLELNNLKRYKYQLIVILTNYHYTVHNNDNNFQHYLLNLFNYLNQIHLLAMKNLIINLNLNTMKTKQLNNDYLKIICTILIKTKKILTKKYYSKIYILIITISSKNQELYYKPQNSK